MNSYAKSKREQEMESQVTEASELLFKLRVIALRILEVAINEIVLHNNLVRESLAKCKNAGFPLVGRPQGIALLKAPHHTQKNGCGRKSLLSFAEGEDLY